HTATTPIPPSGGGPLAFPATNVTPGYHTPNVLPPAMGASPFPAATCVLTNSGFAAVTPPTVGTVAASYPLNSELLFLNTTGNQFTTARLTGAVGGAGGLINLSYTATDATGIWAADPLKISSQAMPSNSTDQLSDQFCAGSYVVPLTQTTYTVDNNNQLYRQQTGGNQDIVADQIIGFKIGLSQFDNKNISSGAYLYDNSYFTRSV